MLHATRIPCAALILTSVAAAPTTRPGVAHGHSTASWFPPSARPRPSR